ncbi:MAG: hypothetical protein IPK63_23220 [Candidatus Competibacteraceae bacterium]|nr:hypothetical protein [Candidatus Competibacteraceae bacterium]
MYNVVTKQLDEAFRLFDVNFKDCQQIEREVALGQNPYHNLVQAGVSDRMRVELGFGGSGTIDDRMRTVRTESAKNGVVMADGKRYGGEGQPPVEPTKNVLQAGYNLLVDRGVGESGEPGSGANAKHPITVLFKSPDELVKFITDIYGNQAFTLTKTGPTQSKPGTGYLKNYIETRDNTIDELQKYVRKETDRKAFEEKTRLLVPPAAIDEMRQLPPYEQSIAIDDQARTFALDQLKLKYDYALQALQTGLQEPNIAQSEAYEVVSREATKLRYTMLDDIQHINTAQFLR